MTERNCPSISVDVAAHTLRLLFRQDALPEGGIGRLEPETQTAVISMNAEGQAQRSTALHEILHFVELVYGLDIPEQTLATLSAAVYALIRNNPELMQWLTKETDIKES